VVLTFEGSVLHGPFRFGAADLPALPRRSFLAASPFGDQRARFEGVSLAGLLEEEMELAKDADIAVFHGRGGYTAPVPIVTLRQLKPVLADRIGDAPVRAWREGAAPLQLAWPNVEHPGIDTDPRMRWWWVEGVEKVSLQNWIGSYGKALRVPAGARDDARIGASVLASTCIVCHRVRGVGGTRGPELSDALVRSRPQPFATRMRDHQVKVSGVTSAPETSPVAAGQVAAFLRAVELAGTRAEDEDEGQTPELPPLSPPGWGEGPGY
jgi:hypothetical protein